MTNNFRGYTLIEILIVMLIMSIVAGAAVLSIHHNQSRRLSMLASEIKNLVSLAEEEALLRPAILALTFSADSFQFVQYDANKHNWRVVTQKPLGMHHLPNNVQATLQIQGKTVADNSAPQLIFSSGGDVTPFVILLGKKGDAPQYQITGENNGEISIEKIH